VKRNRGRTVHVETLAEFDQRIRDGATALRGWRVSGLDLRQRSGVLHRVQLAGATFLGCLFAPGDRHLAEDAGALVLPTISGVPVDPYRSTLYTPGELYDATAYADTLDARAYAWCQQDRQQGADDTLARALHDHAIDEALDRWTARLHRGGQRIVGVMGGHDAQRGDADFALAARLGRSLGQTHVVATGGGPGAMEAANLGAWMAGHGTVELTEALGLLGRVPGFRPSVQAWADEAFGVRGRFAVEEAPVRSLGIPTWHYGHEPPNVFADAIAKYFRNATREAILLEVCDAGIVFLPGAGGTVQEIFQDACENYYADESSVAPMILLGAEYWTETLPAWPLLQRLAKGRVMEGHVHLADSVEEVVALVRR